MCSKFYCQNLWNHHYNKLCYIFTDHSNGWSLIYYWNVNILKGIFYWIQHWGVYIYTFLKDHFKYIKVFQKNTFICTYSLSIEQIKYDRYIKKLHLNLFFSHPWKNLKLFMNFWPDFYTSCMAQIYCLTFCMPVSYGLLWNPSRTAKRNTAVEYIDYFDGSLSLPTH